MAYRVVTLVGGLVFVGVLFGLIWLFCRSFLRRHQDPNGVPEETPGHQATALATWTFTGVSVGLAFAVAGAFVLGPWLFYRTVRGYELDLSDGALVWWGFGVVTLALGLTAAGFAGFLWLVGVL